MRVLYLGVSPFPLSSIIKKNNCEVIECTKQIDAAFLELHSIDFAVSYRFPHIIQAPVIDYLQGQIINLHISLLPWNRGADPNLWSFLENTPKGITIHYIDSGIDTGDIIVQKEIVFDSDDETLATTYQKLNEEIIGLFWEQWPLIMQGKAQRIKQSATQSSKHKKKDKAVWEHLLTESGWETPVRDLVGKALGR